MSDAPPPLIALHQVHKRFDGSLEALRNVPLNSAQASSWRCSGLRARQEQVLRVAAELAMSGTAR